MELEHSFSVPVPVERAWDVLLDVERVAPCMPGASLDSAEGDSISGRIKVKVGPIQMTYAGTAKFTEKDKDTHAITLEASGKETRGAGTASASVRSQLTPDGDNTNVTVHTTLNVTGKPAQFGRGVMTEVGSRLIDIFANNLAAMLAAEPAAEAGSSDDSAHSTGNEVGPAPGPPDQELPIDVLNLQPRVWNSLRKEGIQTLGDLTRRDEQQLRAIEHIGPASVAEIRAKLADRGLALAQEETAATETRATEAAAAPATAADLDGARPAAGKHAAADSADGELADVTPLRPARHESAAHAPAEPASAGKAGSGQPVPAQRPAESSWQPPEDDAIDLLDVAGLPVLKRAVPAAAALLAILLVLMGLRRRRARRR
jgi:carbon monoxide dehydrogenase subunit G